MSVTLLVAIGAGSAIIGLVLGICLVCGLIKSTFPTEWL